MILAIDIGNTNIVIGCIDENKTYFVERLRTDSSKTALEYALDLKNVLELYGITREDLNGSIVASVVPPVSTTIRQAMEKVTGQKPLMVGPGVRTGLNIKVDNPASVGADLIVAAVAAVRDYPAPLIIIDMGTATTMTVVDRNGNYIGGVIIPGLQVALDSLVNRAAQLTKISLDVPSQVIGRNTLNCMQSGSLYGTAAMIDGMIDRMEAELGETATVVATGGLARFVMPLCNHQIQMDDGLLLKGLWIIYQKNQ
ncbi:MAG: type III pantothenate kinase [Lachnospiraceae bacterium]|nr:type III pantothenate kinase [Lachnospiraceae bacterium]